MREPPACAWDCPPSPRSSYRCPRTSRLRLGLLRPSLYPLTMTTNLPPALGVASPPISKPTRTGEPPACAWGCPAAGPGLGRHIGTSRLRLGLPRGAGGAGGSDRNLPPALGVAIPGHCGGGKSNEPPACAWGCPRSASGPYRPARTSRLRLGLPGGGRVIVGGGENLPPALGVAPVRYSGDDLVDEPPACAWGCRGSGSPPDGSVGTSRLRLGLPGGGRRILSLMPNLPPALGAALPSSPLRVAPLEPPACAWGWPRASRVNRQRGD